MKAITVMGMMAALGLAGCALDSGEEQIGDDGEAVHHEDLAFASALDHRIRPYEGFPIANGGSLSVTMEPKWKPADSSYKCRVKAIYIALTKRAPKVDQIGQKAFATMGGPSTASWEGLKAGTYTLDLITANDNPGCVLTGDIRFDTTP